MDGSSNRLELIIFIEFNNGRDTVPGDLDFNELARQILSMLSGFFPTCEMILTLRSAAEKSVMRSSVNIEPQKRKQVSSEAAMNSLQQMEKQGVLSALERNNWIQSRAARDLGITLRQMGYRIKKYNLGNTIRERKGLNTHLEKEP